MNNNLKGKMKLYIVCLVALVLMSLGFASFISMAGF